MVTRHTASLITVNARGWSAAATRDSRCVASVIAVTDHTSALAPAARSPAWSRFQASRHGAEQNRSCSRRGTNEVPHCSHFRVPAATWSIHLTLAGAGKRKVTVCLRHMSIIWRAAGGRLHRGQDRASSQHGAGVERQAYAGDEAGLVGGKEQRGVGHVVRLDP